MKRPILIHPDPRLKKTCEPVTDITPDLAALVEDASNRASTGGGNARLSAQLIVAMYKLDPRRAAALADKVQLPAVATPLDIAKVIGTLAATPLPRSTAAGAGASTANSAAVEAAAAAEAERQKAAVAARVKADRVKRRRRLAAKRLAANPGAVAVVWAKAPKSVVGVWVCSCAVWWCVCGGAGVCGGVRVVGMLLLCWVVCAVCV